jgi:hypothetical protein
MNKNNDKNNDIGAIFLAGLFVIFVVGMIVTAFYLMTSWTQDELGYVVSLIKGTAIHIPFLVAFIVNVVFNAFIFSFDFLVWLLRSLTII